MYESWYSCRIAGGAGGGTGSAWGGGGPLYRNLREYPAWIRHGFDPADIAGIPAESPHGNTGKWMRFEAAQLSVKASPLPDLPKRIFLSPRGKGTQEFTIIIPLELDGAAISFLDNTQGSVQVSPGIYLAIIGINWEIFFNGTLVRSEIHLLIFMDIHMPVMDGLKAASKITGLQTGTPIVAMTANVMSQDRERYRINGMPDCVEKPFTSQQLWKCLLGHLKPVSTETTKNAAMDQADLFLQKRFQVNFLKDNQTIIDKIAAALEAGDMAVAHRLAHTLKGNAALIGKTRLQKAAADAEQILKAGKPPAQKQMSLLKNELDVVLDELASVQATALAAAQTQAQAAGLGIETPDKILAALEQLETMLKNRDPECMVFLDTIRLIPETEQLVRQVENFDFTPALMAISEIKKKFG
jgi:CheY-like chemotaxis protein